MAVGSALIEHDNDREALDKRLAAESREQTQILNDYFARARSLTQITARNPGFRNFYEGDRTQALQESERALAYLEDLFPGSIGEACFIDETGPENARAVRGVVEGPSKLSPDETGAPFFKPTFALKPGQVYQAEPYLSPDTSEWSVSNSTPIPTSDGSKPAIVHFEITMESFRKQAADTSDRFDVAIVEAESGKVIVDSRHAQAAGEKSRLGRPLDRRFASFASTAGRAFGDGSIEAGGRPAWFQRLKPTEHNANDWVVVAIARTPAEGFADAFGVPELAMAALALLLLAFAILSFRSSQAELHHAALADPLTGLGNRRKLLEDLEYRLSGASREHPLALLLYDLDGFKAYNDTFGHPAGDELLQRMATKLSTAVDGDASGYRIGGDEFCVLASVGPDGAEAVAQTASEALSEHGEGFTITSTYGAVSMPAETDDPAEALRVADHRMYARKSLGRASAGRQTTDVLLKVLSEQDPELGEHLDGVAELCEAVAQRLHLSEEDTHPLIQAGALHDVGKAAIPDEILTKPGKLDTAEWTFMRQHTLIGERILGVAPALARAARIVRSTHERMDGGGYPDGLAGEEIPLGSRIVSVCDAYDAMINRRPYRKPLSGEVALAELRRCAGTQFDPVVVDAFVAELRERAQAGTYSTTKP